jgi:hypothetical protein
MEEPKVHHTERTKVADLPPTSLDPSSYSTSILQGLSVDRWYIVKVHSTKGQRGRFFLVPQDKHVYGGTVSYETVQQRRAANRVARKSRRINRLRAR